MSEEPTKLDISDEMIAERYAASIDPARPEGSVNISTNAESDHRFEPDAIRAFTAHGLLG